MRKGLFCLLCIFCLLIPFTSVAKVLDRVVGVVGGEVITLSDLDEVITRYGKAALQGERNPLDREMRLSQARKEALEGLIEEKLLQKVARRYGIKIKDEEVEKTIEKMKKDGGVTDAQMEKELASQGFTLEGYRHYLKTQIRRARIIEYLIKPKISMDESKIREYYQRHANNYLYPQVRVSHILIKVPPKDKATPKDLKMAEDKTKRVLQKLRGGKKFEEVAILYSEDPSAPSGGDLGFFKKGEMAPMLEEVVFKMEVGEVSEILRSSQGFHILKVMEKREGSVPPYEEIKEQVMQDYYRAEVERRYAKWMEDLKARSNVEVKL